MEKKIQLLIWLINLSVFLLFYMPDLLRDGMFGDGLLYATLANNLAHGIGTFWSPQVFSGAPGFHGHPPLVFGIQSVFFRVLGDGMWVERLYSFLAAVVTAYLIISIWRYRNILILPILSCPTPLRPRNMLRITPTIMRSRNFRPDIYPVINQRNPTIRRVFFINTLKATINHQILKEVITTTAITSI